MFRLLAIISFGLFIFFLPLETRLIFDQMVVQNHDLEFGTGSIYLTDILLIISAFFTFIYSKKSVVSKSLNQQKVFSYLLIIGFCLIALSGINMAEDKKIAFYALMRIWEGLILWWLVINNPLKPIFLIFIFIFSSIFQAMWGIEQFFFQLVPENKWLGEALHSAAIFGDSVLQNDNGRFLRAYGTLPHPNILGGFLAVATLLLIGLIISNRDYQLPATSYQLFKWCPLPLLIFGLFFTFSRSGWLALLVGIVVGLIWMWLAKYQKLIIYSIFFITTICLLSLFLIFPEALSRISGQQSLETMSINDRIKEYDDVRIIGRFNPLVGVGPGQYVKKIQNLHPDYETWNINPIHNIYLLILSELGVIGFLLFIIIIAWHLSLIKLHSPPLAIWTASALIGLLIIGLFDHYLWSLHFGVLLFWFILGLIYRLHKEIDLK